ncbi:hypothetical protein BD779DRAFT_1674075 [Infundibulicybe gibba]|nr:hypothetical protein BD779DRAFT_1674075 [Infundibulicybe gibba]
MKTLDPPLDLNGVVAVWLESLLYGIYFCLFLQALRAVILGNKHRRHAAKIFLWASCVLFVVCTAHLVINLYRLMASALWGAPFYDTKHWAVISEITMNAVTTMIANYISLLHRVGQELQGYHRPQPTGSRRIGTGGVVAQEYTTPPASAWVCVGGNMVYVLEFAQNAITTGLIAWNIWMHERSVETMLFAERASLNGVVRIIVESAAIYLVELFILIMLLAADHPRIKARAVTANRNCVHAPDAPPGCACGGALGDRNDAHSQFQPARAYV